MNDDTCWHDLPYANSYQNFLAPGTGFKALIAVLLAPQVATFFYGLFPKTAQRDMHALTWVMLLISAISGVLFLATLCYSRNKSRRCQLALNTSLVDGPPQDFVLYLRSFRRTGALFVPNSLPKLVKRRLMGNFWDIELDLSHCLTEKLPLVSMGIQS